MQKEHDQEELREQEAVIAQQFADTGYTSSMAVMFPQSQIMQMNPGVKTSITYQLNSDKPIVASSGQAGTMLSVSGREVKVKVLGIKSSIAPDFDDYETKTLAGEWNTIFASLSEQAMSGMYRAMDATLFGGNAVKQLVEARNNKVFQDSGFFDNGQTGVYKFPFALPAKTYAAAVRSISMIHDKVRHSDDGAQLRVNRIAIDERLYSMLQELTDPGTGVTVIDKILKKYPSVQFLPILGFSGVMAYDDVSPFHKIAMGSYPGISSMGESWHADGSQSYRVHLEAQFGGNLFGRDNVFAASYLDLELESLTSEQFASLKPEAK